MQDDKPKAKDIGWAEKVAPSWARSFALALMVYVLSSGPVLGLAFWLRERTHQDGFYAAMWLYYPLFMLRMLGHDGPIDAYIEWWVVSVFRTVGPG